MIEMKEKWQTQNDVRACAHQTEMPSDWGSRNDN